MLDESVRIIVSKYLHFLTFSFFCFGVQIFFAILGTQNNNIFYQ